MSAPPIERSSSFLPANVQRQLEGRQWSTFATICTAILFNRLLGLSNPNDTSLSHFVLYSTYLAFAQACLPFIAWYRFGRTSVPLGLLVDFFWLGGVLSAQLAGVANVMTIIFWQIIFPHCAILAPSHLQTPACQAMLLAEWILTPGWWEEILKASFLLLRLKVHAKWAKSGEGRYTTDRVPKTTCCCIPTPWCGCWWRIVRNPEAVFLCGVSVGAGFGAIENIQYMINPQEAALVEPEKTFFSNLQRTLIPMHVFLTGFVGLQLAKRNFGPTHKRPSLFACLAPSIIFHGVWDWLAVNGDEVFDPGTNKMLLMAADLLCKAWFVRLLQRGSLGLGIPQEEGSTTQEPVGSADGEPPEEDDVVKDNSEILSSFLSMAAMLMLYTTWGNPWENTPTSGPPAGPPAFSVPRPPGGFPSPLAPGRR